jgi:hypothetical protein
MLPPRLATFGLTVEGDYDPELAPAHEIAIVRATFGGRGKISYTALVVPYPLASGLRASVAATLARLDREIEEAEGATAE